MSLLENPLVKDVLSEQNLGVLATTGKEYPYTTLISFIMIEDGLHIIFSTMRQTRKYKNIVKHPKVSILVSTSKNNIDDFKDAVSITLLGTASITEGEEREKAQKVFLGKFPFLEDFVSDPSSELIRVRIEKAIVVTRFQNVREITL